MNVWAETEATGDEEPRFVGNGKTRKALSPVLITVYDDCVSRIQWADQMVWSNVAFTGFPVFGEIEEGETVYSWFAIVTESAATSGLPDLDFSADGTVEYLVTADEESDVGEDLFWEMDLLHAYYLANEDGLRAEQQRAKALQAARKRYLENNPPKSKETVVNFSPIYSRNR